MDTITIRTPTRRVLHDAAKNGRLDELTALLDEQPDSISAVAHGFMPIHLAAKGGHTEAITLLLSRGAAVDARASNGATPLHCAAEMNRTHALSLLLNHGAELNGSCDRGGDSALHHAALNGRLAATKLLVSRGADVHATNEHGSTPHDDAVELGRGRCPCEDPTAREWGAVGAFLSHVMRMDEAGRVAFAQRAWDRPAAAMLHDAAELGDCSRLKTLLTAGSCDLEARDYDGSTCIHAAVEGGYLPAVTLLLDARADVNALTNYRDSAAAFGRTRGAAANCAASGCSRGECAR